MLFGLAYAVKDSLIGRDDIFDLYGLLVRDHNGTVLVFIGSSIATVRSWINLFFAENTGSKSSLRTARFFGYKVEVSWGFEKTGFT